MSHLFWEMTAIYSICYALCLIGIGVASDRENRMVNIGSVLAVGAVIYMVSAVIGLIS